MKNANDSLAQFTGTGCWYRYPLSEFLYTEGVQALAEEFQCYWLLDLVFAAQISQVLRDRPFQTWKLRRIMTDELGPESCRFVVIADDGNDNRLYSRIIPFSDFSADEVILYFIDGVLLLPSEY